MISIIVPTYNKIHTLPLCLDSIVAQQGIGEYEIIVVDDGSQDLEKVKTIVSGYKHIQFIAQENKGAPSARNKGFDESKGEYVIFVDDDVVMKPHMLSTMLNTLKKQGSDFAYSSFKLGNKVFALHEFSYEKLKKQNYIHTTSLMKREVFPYFDESLKKFQDWDLWLTISEQKKKGSYIPEVLFQIVETHGTMSTWLPRFMYRIPWSLLGYIPKPIKRYRDAENIIKNKHKL
ncbi:MAG: glycosyltransferase family 2 protein [Patescibacteria group bacterium]